LDDAQLFPTRDPQIEKLERTYNQAYRQGAERRQCQSFTSCEFDSAESSQFEMPLKAGIKSRNDQPR
jgi:hypothetical protein